MEAEVESHLSRNLVDTASTKIFTSMVEDPLSEAELVAATTQALAMRLAFSSKDLASLEIKLKAFPEIFLRYARANLSAAQSSILAKNEAIKGMN